MVSITKNKHLSWILEEVKNIFLDCKSFQVFFQYKDQCLSKHVFASIHHVYKYTPSSLILLSLGSLLKGIEIVKNQKNLVSKHCLVSNCISDSSENDMYIIKHITSGDFMLFLRWDFLCQFLRSILHCEWTILVQYMLLSQ